jgi:FkbM family methyltransferase
MQFSTRVKLTLRKYFPEKVVGSIRVVAAHTVLLLPSFLFTLKTLGFTKRMVKEVTYAKNRKFKIIIDPKNGYLDAQVYAKKLYEPHIVKEFVDNIKEGDVCIDVGANIGHHTIIMAQSCGPTGKVYAFEPIPLMQQQMRESIDLNGIRTITIVPVALSDQEGELPLHINEGTIASSSFVANSKGDDLIVPLRTLDSYAYEKIDFIKVDVEGFEYKVFLGGKQTIASNHPTILFEYSPIYYRKYSPNDTLDILTFLKGNGYRMVDLEDNRREITDIHAYSYEFREGFRTQTNILAF